MFSVKAMLLHLLKGPTAVVLVIVVLDLTGNIYTSEEESYP